jgi:hypothetical protein
MELEFKELEFEQLIKLRLSKSRKVEKYNISNITYKILEILVNNDFDEPYLTILNNNIAYILLDCEYRYTFSSDKIYDAIRELSFLSTIYANREKYIEIQVLINTLRDYNF